jgi:hypothetical protein
MAKLSKDITSSVDRTCTGGQSFGCRREEHAIGKIPDLLCYRCLTRLGCSTCVESAHERICLSCHNWGTRAGVQRHGNVVPSHKHPRVRTDDGWSVWTHGQRDAEREAAAMIKQLPF